MSKEQNIEDFVKLLRGTVSAPSQDSTPNEKDTKHADISE